MLFVSPVKQPLGQKCSREISFVFMNINLLAKHISIGMALYKHLLLHRGKRQLGKGLLVCDYILQEIEKSTFHTLSEHRTWCPWVVDMRGSDGSSTPAGWRLLLGTLLPSLSPTATHLIHEVNTDFAISDECNVGFYISNEVL